MCKTLCVSVREKDAEVYTDIKSYYEFNLLHSYQIESVYI